MSNLIAFEQTAPYLASPHLNRLPINPTSAVILTNMMLMLRIDSYSEFAEVMTLHKSTISKWAGGSPIPLRYCIPFLRYVSYRRLQDQKGLDPVNIGRGHTNSQALAAPDPRTPGPIFITQRTHADGVLSRLISLVSHLPFGSEIAPHGSLRLWKHRNIVPDAAVLTIAKTTNAPVEWLLLGIDHDLGQ